MNDKHPDFVAKLEKHGLIYTRVFGEEDDPSSPIGRSWKATFLTTHRSVAEERFVYINLHNFVITERLKLFVLITGQLG